LKFSAIAYAFLLMIRTKPFASALLKARYRSNSPPNSARSSGLRAHASRQRSSMEVIELRRRLKRADGDTVLMFLLRSREHGGFSLL
jgi:hypothetical protein